MKTAFTMIELIFVIVILGVLAAVAIPKLNATRDDAEIVKSSQNLAILISDLGSYYTTQTNFSSNLKDMTSQSLKDDKYFTIKNTDCLEVTTDDYFIVVKKLKTRSELCNKLLGLESLKQILTGRISKTNNNFTDISKSDVIYIPVGGSNVVY
ncbi:prepilin-type N-terminal cleavage/methylation domain-containing protein [Campylobacter sp. RM9334]|uniref:type II secretion system protein n=2 Tax=Campylobacter TaxID=194 RepID=UPI001DF9A3B3|nr:prepilin-type N-terminal cleavage/methylation domain-containing protein [Campylobacter sp. RM12651]MBZ7983983.1 prepilin-type N-terminal cleavage/methylation domain-containing protein [Campylobacter sp. RM12647]MBZ8006715.1 prepilin-type N-terminal cleavage/methylation domain-containing protein [Campylobacter sp. RM9334]ULO04299.1 putative type II secretion system protein [Campylobacter sp. RM12651]